MLRRNQARLAHRMKTLLKGFTLLKLPEDGLLRRSPKRISVAWPLEACGWFGPLVFLPGGFRNRVFVYRNGLCWEPKPRPITSSGFS